MGILQSDAHSVMSLPSVTEQMEMASPALICIMIASVLVLVMASVLAMINIVAHVRVLRKELDLQVYGSSKAWAPIIINTLAVVYAWYTVVSLFFMRLNVLMHALAATWQGLCLYLFFFYTLDVLAGPEETLLLMRQLGKAKWYSVFPLGCAFRCYKPREASVTLLRVAKNGVLQLTIARPVLYLTWLGLLLIGGASTDETMISTINVTIFIIGIIMPTSSMIGMWAFNILYRGVGKYFSQQGRRPLLKFIAVQTLMIMDSVNGAFIGILPLESHDQVFRAGGARQGWTSVMFIFEVFIISIMLYIAFPVERIDKLHQLNGAPSLHVRLASRQSMRSRSHGAISPSLSLTPLDVNVSDDGPSMDDPSSPLRMSAMKRGARARLEMAATVTGSERSNGNGSSGRS